MSSNITPQRRTASIASVASMATQGNRSPNIETPIQQFANLSLLSPVKRPTFGTLGKPVSALVNLFEIDTTKLPDFLQYTFKVKSKDKDDSQVSGRYRARIATLFLSHNDRFKFAASDYSTIFISTKPLTPDERTSFTYEVDYFEIEESGPRSGDRKLVFQVNLTFRYRFSARNLQNYLANQSNDYLTIQQHLAVINIALARGPAQDPNVTTTARREKFFGVIPNDEHASLGFGLQVMRGFYRSARITLSGLQVNLNTATCATYREGPLHTLIHDVLGKQHFKDGEAKLRYLDVQLTNIRVETQYLGRPVRQKLYRMARSNNRSLPPTSANITFIRDRKVVGVQQYFATTYPNFRRNDLGAFVVNVGDHSKAIYIPSDLCHVVAGQPYRSFLPVPAQASKMIKLACRLPGANLDLILREGLPQMGVGVNGGPKDRFGIEVSSRMMTVGGRCLPSPSLSYASLQDRRTDTGSWNLVGKKFKYPAAVNTTEITCIQLLSPTTKKCSNLGEFVTNMQLELQRYLGKRGIVIKNFPDFNHTVQLPAEVTTNNLLTPLSQLAQRGVKLVLVVLPSKSRQIYRHVKLAADATGSGIHTVCITRDEGTGDLKAAADKLANMALKINFKLGGSNWGFIIPSEIKFVFEKKVMFVGADVVHPGKNAMVGAPSIASVVASCDSTYAIYPGSVSFQFPKHETKKAVEFIEHFGDMVEARLKFFASRNNGALPDSIFIYRDGVADNMFAEVLTQEMLQAQRVYKKLYISRTQPQTVLIVTQKRIHIRFYQPKENSSVGFDRNGNPLPGFVVDSKITSRTDYDFYIVAHKGLQGTCVPVRHIVLHNDLNLDPNRLQYITYSLSFLFQRATKSISTPAPVRCADRLAWRAKTFFDDVYNPPPVPPNEPKPVYRASNPDHWQGKIAERVKDTMFYL